MQDLRPDFVPVLSVMPPDDTPFDERAQRTIESLKAAVELELRFEIHLGDVPVTGAVMDALENAMTAPGARITAFHFEQRWAESPDGRFVNRRLLERLRDSLQGCKSLQVVSGGAGVLWLLDRPVEQLAVTFERQLCEDELGQLQRVLVNGVAQLSCAAEAATVFPSVAQVVQRVNEHATAETAVRSVALVYPYRPPRNDTSGVDAARLLLTTTHLKRLTLPGTEWLNLVDDNQLIACIRRFGLQDLDFGSVNTLSPEARQALAANRNNQPAGHQLLIKWGLAVPSRDGRPDPAAAAVHAFIDGKDLTPSQNKCLSLWLKDAMGGQNLPLLGHMQRLNPSFTPVLFPLDNRNQAGSSMDFGITLVEVAGSLNLRYVVGDEVARDPSGRPLSG
jgi:hypothetical protein